MLFLCKEVSVGTHMTTRKQYAQVTMSLYHVPAVPAVKLMLRLLFIRHQYPALYRRIYYRLHAVITPVVKRFLADMQRVHDLQPDL